MKTLALILEDNQPLASTIAKVVQKLGYDARVAGGIAAARQIVAEHEPALMVIDVNLPDGDGLEFIKELRRTPGSSSKFIVITGDMSQQVAVKCIRAGAFDMLPKPVKLAEIRASLKRLIETSGQQLMPVEAANQTLHDGSTIHIGESEASVDLRQMIQQASRLDGGLMVIEGEPGTEKSSVAEAVHAGSARLGRLVTVNCANERDDNAHARFFGVESNGELKHPGYLEQAAAGTLVLDDFTELPRELQARLLAYLDTGQFLRTNGLQPVRASVAVIGIARSAVREALDEGRLREDFYYRLAQFIIRVPRLQQRGDDKVIIAERLLADINERQGTRKVLSEQARRAIDDYSWPGNARELKNALHRACLECHSKVAIDLLDLESNAPEEDGEHIREFVGKTFWQIEKELLFATLDHSGGDKEKTSRMLGISLKTLYNRLHAYS